MLGEKPTAIYTIDGKKEWALSLIFSDGDKGAKSASMSFVGSALALHTLDGTEFTATVSIHAQARTIKPTEVTVDNIKEITYPDQPPIHPEILEKNDFWSPPEVVKVTDGVWVAVGFDLTNSILIGGDDGIIIVDTLSIYENAKKVIDEFRDITDKPVKAIIYTHAHLDHVSGTGAFVEEGEDVEIYAHESSLDFYINENSF